MQLPLSPPQAVVRHFLGRGGERQQDAHRSSLGSAHTRWTGLAEAKFGRGEWGSVGSWGGCSQRLLEFARGLCLKNHTKHRSYSQGQALEQWQQTSGARVPVQAPSVQLPLPQKCLPPQSSAPAVQSCGLPTATTERGIIEPNSRAGRDRAGRALW